MHAKLGFNFFGTGNIGDDFMLAGFLAEWSLRRPLFGVVDKNQQRILKFRFPTVEWITAEDPQPAFDLWLGVGGTPVQILSGKYFLEFLEHELLKLPTTKCRVVFVGVGVEREAVGARERYRRVLDRIDIVGTRDQFSSEILKRDFGMGGTRVVDGQDLANIYFRSRVKEAIDGNERPVDLAVNYYSERSSFLEWFLLHRWVQKDFDKKVAISICNETRIFRRSEASQYAHLAWLLQMGARGRSIPLLVNPNYSARTVEELWAHYSSIDTLLTSRFHGVIAGAWAGCRVGVFKRSSKIEAVRSEFGLPSIRGDVTESNLRDLMAAAVRVPNTKLEAAAGLASKALRDVLQ